MLGKHTDWNRPPCPGTIVTIYMSYFITGGPGKERGTTKPSPIRSVGKGQKEMPRVLPPPRILLPGMHLGLSSVCTIRKDSESEWLARENSETNPITIKPETASHKAEQFSLVPWPYTSPPRCPFPIKPLALSAHVSPQTIDFQVLDKSELLGPRRGLSGRNIKQE